MNFHHIGIFVASLKQGRDHLGILGVGAWSDEINDPVLKVSVQFGVDVTGLRYELVAPNGEGNPVDGVLASRRNILNHLAFTVPDLGAAIASFRNARALPLSVPSPAVAFGGRQVIFMLTPLGMIVELIGA